MQQQWLVASTDQPHLSIHLLLSLALVARPQHVVCMVAVLHLHHDIDRIHPQLGLPTGRVTNAVPCMHHLT